MTRPVASGAPVAEQPCTAPPLPRTARRALAEGRSGRSPWARSAWCSATSAPARSTPCARRWPTPRPTGRDRRGDLGVVSLVLWALILMVTVKYVHLPDARRQQGRGRGAVADGPGAAGARPAHRPLFFMLGVIGAALFYGDGVITPAISVLSARRGPEGRAGDLGQPAARPMCCRSPPAS